jgi:serine protease AprX
MRMDFSATADSSNARANALWGSGGGRRLGSLLVAAFTVLAAFAGTASAKATSSSGTGSSGSGTTYTAFMTTSLKKAIAANPRSLFNVVVKGTKGTNTTTVASDENASITANPASGSGIKKQFTVINGTSSRLSGKQIESLSHKTRIASITEDGRTGSTGFSNLQLWPEIAQVSSFFSSPPSGPAIAIVDSGVDAARAADFGARVVAEVSVCSNGSANAKGDGFGHGTFVASIAAGGADGYTGAAPGANIVSVDALDDTGAGQTSDVIDAAEWIYRNKDRYNIRVANFSLIAGANSSFMYDPLDQAVEKLWLSGVVVVTAVGNYASGGAASGVPYAPANDPFAITVGAADTAGTLSTADDFNAPWSAYGYTNDGFAKPELGAPGRYMNGAAPSASAMYAQHSERIVAPGYLWMSGTSFAAPVVAGAAADLLALHPGWTPDQVKGALMVTTAQPGPSTGLNALGVGEVKAASANAVPSPPNPNAGLNNYVVTDPNGGKVFDPAAWMSAAQANASWNSASWNSASWNSASWNSASWNSASWNSASWNSASWNSGQTVDGSLPSASWNSLTWVG